MNNANALEKSPAGKGRLLARMSDKFGVDSAKLVTTLKHTAFRVQEGEVTNEQLMALMVVADQYGLNPFTKEIYAFPDRQGIVPVVGVDGWSRIINQHPEFDGMEFEETDTEEGQPYSNKCTMYRKDRTHPISAREYFSEVIRPTGPWKSHPRRMLRHKSMIQCARLAFGFAGIYDPDEAERIRDIRIIEDELHQMGKPEVAQPNRKSERKTIEQQRDFVPAVTETKAESEQESPNLDTLRAAADEAGWNEKELCKIVQADDYDSMDDEQVSHAFAVLEGADS